MAPRPDEQVIAWLDAEEAEGFSTTAITVAEALFGVARLAAGARKRALEVSYARLFEWLPILPFDRECAGVAASLQAETERGGVKREFRDLYIAAIAKRHEAALATRNQRHFEGLGLRLITP